MGVLNASATANRSAARKEGGFLIPQRALYGRSWKEESIAP